MDPSYPRLLARTQGFSLGQPTHFTLSPDGGRVLFLRTRGGQDPVRCLWALDVASGEETLLADPLTLGGEGAEMSEQERIRRERERDQSSGIAAYTTDSSVRAAAFALNGRLFVADTGTGSVAELPAATPVDDPRLSPSGDTVGYVSAGALRVIGVDGKDDRALAEPDGPEVSWGLPEHEAAESMDRHRGYWWSPAGDRIVAARVDNSPVRIWYLADPTRPEAAPRAIRYPYAGTPNADVTLWLFDLSGARTPVDLHDEYVTAVTWDDTALLAVVQNRRQTVMRVVEIDPATGRTAVVRTDTDDAWTTIVAGLPAHTGDGALVWSVDDGDTRRLTVGGEPVTPPGLQLFEVLGVDGDTVLFTASEEPTESHLWTWSAAAGPVRLTEAPGLYGGSRSGGTTLVRASTWDGDTVTVDGRSIAGHATPSPVIPRVDLFPAGELGLRTAVLFPTGHVPGSRKLPVLMDPYGGPAAQRATAARAWYYRAQWFADQGFAVVIGDGRGTPGRGPVWERTIHGNRTDVLLQDQVDALHAAAERHPDLDPARVAIRGWSAGGLLAALAVLRRPDVFHAAAAGAPVTEQLLYSTHWQERYLGDPHEHPEAYEHSSLIADAPNLRRPLLLIHGLADDNVHPAHTMRLSAALLAAGRPHSVLPVSGASHMTSATETTANLMILQARFLLDSLSPVRDLAAPEAP
jgi:dipeptidyl-peptidase-4